MIVGLYRAGTSPLHRLDAGWKLAALLAGGSLLFVVDDLALAAAALAATLALYRVASIPAGVVVRQIRPALPVLALLFLAQLFVTGPAAGALLVLRFAALILAAALVTLTTRTADLVGGIERGLSPLSRLGIDAAKTGLAISLAIRFIPAVGTIVEEVREAQWARGQERSVVALAVPAIVRLLKNADAIAEAIDARS